MSERTQSIAAIAVHLLMIALAFPLMQNNGDVYFFIGCGIWGIYLIAFFICNAKRWMPWRSVLIFTLGTALEFALHLFGVIPAEHSEFFTSGWNQVFYLFGLIAYTLLLAILNLLFWLAHHKAKGGETHAEQTAGGNSASHSDA